MFCPKSRRIPLTAYLMKFQSPSGPRSEVDGFYPDVTASLHQSCTGTCNPLILNRKNLTCR